MEVGKNGKFLNEALKKICQLTKVFLRKPKLIFLDEDALVIPEFDTSYFIEVLFKEMKAAGIFSICKNFRNLHYYTRVYVMKNGTIVENDNPLTLVSNKKS